jgi:hypothetical protein
MTQRGAGVATIVASVEYLAHPLSGVMANFKFAKVVIIESMPEGQDGCN